MRNLRALIEQANAILDAFETQGHVDVEVHVADIKVTTLRIPLPKPGAGEPAAPPR
jgi:hypothetical protein